MLVRRHFSLKSAAARMCREAGARVFQNVFVRDLNLGIVAQAMAGACATTLQCAGGAGGRRPPPWRHAALLWPGGKGERRAGGKRRCSELPAYI